ncbi:MAG: hypothetical protein ACLQMO_05085 [Acidobacteriaceae bacterium]
MNKYDNPPKRDERFKDPYIKKSQMVASPFEHYTLTSMGTAASDATSRPFTTTRDPRPLNWYTVFVPNPTTVSLVLPVY